MNRSIERTASTHELSAMTRLCSAAQARNGLGAIRYQKRSASWQTQELSEGNPSVTAELDPCTLTYSELFLTDLNRLFRTALLITGSIESAERALVEAIDLLSEFEPPGGLVIRDVIRFAVARSSVGVLRAAECPSDSATESALILLKELRIVFNLPPGLRCCFVLRTLAGYTSEQVGLLMDIRSEDVETLAQDALVRLAELASERKWFISRYGWP
jgi:hypothetical protein